MNKEEEMLQKNQTEHEEPDKEKESIQNALKENEGMKEEKPQSRSESEKDELGIEEGSSAISEVVNEKKLKSEKGKEKLEKFDSRGVQTLFRTVTRNHYTLLRMVDNKASIILTINSIIISLLMGVLYIAPETETHVIRIGASILLNCCMLSMIFALFSMLPHKYIGRLYKVSKYHGSLYAGNFASLSLEEFKQEFDRIMSSGKSVYNEMIQDLYFLGKTISHKQTLLLISVAVFLFGLMATFIYMGVNGFSVL